MPPRNPSLLYSGFGGDVRGTYPRLAVTQVQGLRIEQDTPVAGQVLGWTGTAWAPVTPSASSSFVSNPYNCDASVAIGDAVYLAGTEYVDKASAADPATIPAIGIVVDKPDSTTAVVGHYGVVSSVLTGLTPGAVYYVDTTAGGVTSSAPTSSGQVVQMLGVALSANKLMVTVTPFATFL